MADTIYKSFVFKTVGTDLEKRTIDHYITAPTVDEDGEVLLPRGGDISRFRKTGGTVFDVHQYGTKDVVGSNRAMKMQDDGIVATTRFSPRPPTHPENVEWWPDSLLWLYHIGDIKGWSVGFTILDARNPTKQDTARWGDGLRRVITRWRLLEYSCAPLPCNADAVTLSVKGLISPRLAETLKSGRLPTRNEYAAAPAPTVPAPKQIITLTMPAEKIESAPVPRKIVFLIPPEPKVVQVSPVGLSLDEISRNAAELAIRKARGEMFA